MRDKCKLKQTPGNKNVNAGFCILLLQTYSKKYYHIHSQTKKKNNGDAGDHYVKILMVMRAFLYITLTSSLLVLNPKSLLRKIIISSSTAYELLFCNLYDTA